MEQNFQLLIDKGINSERWGDGFGVKADKIVDEGTKEDKIGA